MDETLYEIQVDCLSLDGDHLVRVQPSTVVRVIEWCGEIARVETAEDIQGSQQTFWIHCSNMEPLD